jgi:hypothetical protein
MTTHPNPPSRRPQTAIVVALTSAVTLILAGVAVFLLARGSDHTVQGVAQTSAATRSTPAAPRQTTAKPKPAAKPKPKPAPRTTVTKTVPAPAPAPAQPPQQQAQPQQHVQSDPWAVISAYYGDVTSGAYWDAWNLLGPDFQANQGSYDQFVAGYRGTGAQYVFELGESGNQVTYYLESHNPDGTIQTYEGTATVYDGKMQHADVHQISGRPAG